MDSDILRKLNENIHTHTDFQPTALNVVFIKKKQVVRQLFRYCSRSFSSMASNTTSEPNPFEIQ